MKKQAVKIQFIVFLFFAFLSTALYPNPSPAQSPNSRSEQTLLVSSDYDYPPYEYNDAQGYPTGFNIDLIRAAAEAVGLRADIKLGVWNEVREKLKSGEIDIIAGMYYSREREKTFDFSVSHNMVSSALFVRDESPIRTFEQARERVIIVQKGDIMHDYLVEQGFTEHIVAVNDPIQALQLLASGNHDGVLLSSKIQGLYFLNRNAIQGLRVVETHLPARKYCFAVRKNDTPLLMKLNEGLNILKHSGKYEELYEKWFGIYKEKSLWQTSRYFLIAFTSILLLLAVVSAITWILRLQVKKRTRELLLSEERYRHMIQNARDILYVTDEQERILYINPVAEFITGYQSWEMEKRCFLDFIHPDFRDEIRATYERQCAERTPNTYHEFPLIAKDSRVVWVGQNTQLLESGGKVLGFQAIARDITDRRQVEEELRKNRQFLSDLIENSGALVFVKDREGRYEMINRKWEDVTGLKRQAVIGKMDEDLFPGRIGRQFRLNDMDVMQSRSVTEIEEILEDGHGERFFISIKFPLFGDDGSVLGICGMTTEITDRKRAEQALQESEALLSESQKIAHIGSWSLDVSTKRLTCSDEIYRIFGFTPQESGATYEAFLEAVHPEDRGAMLAAYSNSLRQRQNTCELEYRIVRKRTGEVRHAQGKCVHFRDAHGVVIRSIGMVQDITERKQSEAERTLLATVVEQAEENVLVTDERRTILYINPAFEHSSGYSNQDLKGKKLRVLRSAQHDEAYYRKMKTILDRGEMWAGVIINKGKDDREFEIEGTISPIRDASGSITHFLVVGRNMSRFRKLERELHQAQKMESVGRLAGGVAHDFNNMLGVIIGHAELALKKIDAKESAHYDMQEILKAANRSAKLTRQLLAFARKQTIRPEVLDINETVESMLKMVRRLIGEDIELIWSPCPDLWPVKIDPTQIDQILANLCINARDAIAGVGKVTIETDNVTLDETFSAGRDGFSPGEYVLLHVNDNGCGMGKDVLDKLFEPFFTTKDAGKGTGLGLATVYGIVKQNNGFIEVDSEPGRGSSFKVYIPRTDAPVSEKSQLLNQERDLNGNETILMVEDEEPILELGRSILELHGYRVLTARNAAEALALAEKHRDRLHLLITDVVMPGMNGKDLVNKLSTLRPGFKTIFISGYTADIISDHGVLDAGVHFLQKPFSVQGMALKVREVLDI